MTWIQILKLFSNRPLSCRFERDPNQKPSQPSGSPDVRKKKTKKKEKTKDDADAPAEEEVPPEVVEAVFTEEDRPPLGLDMDWRQPPEVIQVMASTPAARHGIKARDKLQTVNGVEVASMPREQILPLFGQRPLRVTFLREQRKKKKRKAKKDGAEGGDGGQPALPPPDGDDTAPGAEKEDEATHEMAPPASVSGNTQLTGNARVPIPSTQFIGRYMSRLEERQKAAPKETFKAKDQEELDEEAARKNADVEAQKSRAFVLRESLNVVDWSGPKIFIGVMQSKHRAFQWMAAQAESMALLRCLQFWIYVFTYFALVAIYSRPDQADCTVPPAAADVKCIIDPAMNATEAAIYRAQCDAYKENLNSLQVEYENCQARAYFINLPFFKMSAYAFVVTILTSSVSAILIGLLNFSFKKKKIRDKRSIAEKLRIVQFWKVKELFALFFAMVWISLCVYYLFMFAVNMNNWEYASKNGFAMLMQWGKPMINVYFIYLVISYGAKFPLGRFVLVLSPGIMDLKHMVFEKPEDLVAARRERAKRKDSLRREVQRLRKSVDRDAADRLREETVERVASKGSRASQGSRGRPGASSTVESEKKA
jgi:hypothetical protein